MSNLVELTIPQPSQVAVTDAQAMRASALAFRITDATQSVELQSARQRINTRIKTLNEERLAITRPIDAAKQKVVDFFAPPLIALNEALRACDSEILAWNAQVERERKEAQRVAELEATRERARLQAIADEAAARERAEQAQRDLEKRQADERARLERERLAQLAADARRQGDAEAAREAEAQAEQVRRDAEAAQRERDRVAAAAALTASSKVEVFSDRAETLVAPVAVADLGAVKGVGLRDNWTFEVIDPTRINVDFMVPDAVKIGKLVKAMKEGAGAIIGAGVRVYNAPIVASRRAGP